MNEHKKEINRLETEVTRMRQVLNEMAKKFVGISVDDLTGAENQVISLLILEGLLEFNNGTAELTK